MVWIALYSSDTFELECMMRYSNVIGSFTLCDHYCREEYYWECKTCEKLSMLNCYPRAAIRGSMELYYSTPHGCVLNIIKRRRKGGLYVRRFIDMYFTYKHVRHMLHITCKYEKANDYLVDDDFLYKLKKGLDECFSDFRDILDIFEESPYRSCLTAYKCVWLTKFDVWNITYQLIERNNMRRLLGYSRRVRMFIVKCLYGNRKGNREDFIDLIRKAKK